MYNKTLSIDPNDCPIHTPYVVLFIVFLSISVIVSSTFIYFHWYKNKRSDFKNILNANYSKIETKIYWARMYKMVTKQINLKNRSYYFWNDQIGLITLMLKI